MSETNEEKRGRPRKIVLSNDLTKVKAPSKMNPEEAAYWWEVAERLAAKGTLNSTVPKLLEVYSLNSYLMDVARADLYSNGPVIYLDNGRAQANPANATINAASMRINSSLVNMGLTIEPGGAEEDTWNGTI
jgi:phage terminase small subunit